MGIGLLTDPGVDIDAVMERSKDGKPLIALGAEDIVTLDRSHTFFISSSHCATGDNGCRGSVKDVD